jgi:hypothetical protein
MGDLQKIMGIATANIQKVMGIAVGSVQKVCGLTYPAAGGLPLAGWSYRKSITLSRASGAVSNYQMKLLVGESSGATGEDVDCGGNCATDFDDIRFTKSDGTTLLDYWIESISGATPNQLATIWVEFDSIGTSATTFYMYYGHADAAAYSNGANTFILFEDFNALSDGDLNGQNGWSGNTAFDVQTTTKYEGAKALSAGAINGNISHAISPGHWNIWVEAYLYCTTATTAVDVCALFAMEGAAEVTAIEITSGVLKHLVPAVYWVSVGVSAANSTWYKVKMAFDSQTTHSVWVDDTLKDPASHENFTNVSSVIDKIKLERWNTGAGTACWDRVIVGQYFTTGPAWGAWGAQES